MKRPVLNSHTVLKNNDIFLYCNESQLQQLEAICKTIRDGRIKDGKPIPDYYICNTDEPYAENVLNVIIEGEKTEMIEGR